MIKVKQPRPVSERVALSRAKEFLRGCKPAKSSRYLSHLLALDIGSTSEAVIQTATALRLPVIPVKGTCVAVIGISVRSLRARGILR